MVYQLGTFATDSASLHVDNVLISGSPWEIQRKQIDVLRDGGPPLEGHMKFGG